MERPKVLLMNVRRITCEACGVWAPIQVAGTLPSGTVIYAVTPTCEICKQNRSYAAS